MEGLAFVYRASERYLCYSEVKLVIFSKIPVGTLNSWVSLLGIQKHKPEPHEHAFFRQVIPETALGDFSLIYEGDVAKLTQHADKATLTKSMSLVTREPQLDQQTAVQPAHPATCILSELHSDPRVVLQQQQQTVKLSEPWRQPMQQQHQMPVERQEHSEHSQSEDSWTSELHSAQQQQQQKNPVQPCEPRQLDADEPRQPVKQSQSGQDAERLFPRQQTVHELWEPQKKLPRQQGWHYEQQQQAQPLPSSQLAPSQQPLQGREVETQGTSHIANARIRGRGSAYALRVSDLSQAAQREVMDLRQFYSSTLNFHRRTPSLGASTIDKMIERAMCFLSYARTAVPTELSLHLVEDLPLVQAYIKHIGNQRDLKSVTKSRHVGALINVARFLNGGNKESSSPCLDGLRALQRQLEASARGEKLVEQSKDELLDKRKVSFPEVLEVCRELMHEIQETYGVNQARVCHDLVLLLMYCCISPTRAKEYITLRIWHGSDTSEIPLEGGNWLVFKEDGEIVLYQGSYKTVKSYGPSVINISDVAYVASYLNLYVTEKRGRLMSGKEHTYCFVNSSGDPFSSSSFTGYLGRLFQRYCSMKLSTNDLRKAAVTYFLSLPEARDEQLRESVASVMKHSCRAQKWHYDKRPESEKRARGSEFFSRQLANAFLPETTSAVVVDEEDEHGFEEVVPSAGDFVALAAANSTTRNPEIFLARLLRLTPDNHTALLSHFSEVEPEHAKYRMVAGKSYREDVRALVYPIDIVFDHSDGLYQLRTTKREIHDIVKKDHS